MRFALDEQQRDFAASIDAALGAADLPGAVRAWSALRDARPKAVWVDASGTLKESADLVRARLVP